MTVRVNASSDESRFDIPEWGELLARDPDKHLFATPEWNKIWWQEFNAGKDLVILTMEREGELIAIVPLYRKQEDGRKVLRFVGGIDLTDYLGPICSKSDRADVAEGLVAWLGDTVVAWDDFDARSMPVRSDFAALLQERADHHGLDYELRHEETVALLELPEDWDSYLDSLGSKERHELKRKLRRLERDHPDAEVRSATAETLERDLKVFIEMHRGAEGHKGHFMNPDIATFFERVAHAFMPLSWLRLDFMEVGGRPIASTFGFHFSDRFYLYNSAYEPSAGRLSPGLVLVTQLIRRSIAEGCAVFDFLRGEERYKFDLGGEAVPLQNVKIFGPDSDDALSRRNEGRAIS
jgi:CelD/BcsL family acetyltransferase involved in cellulose biosynthesis